MNDAEQWAPVGGYEGTYEVSSAGRIRSLDRIDNLGRNQTGKVLATKPSNGAWRHHKVRLSAEGIVVTRLLHRLVAEAFLGGSPFDGAVVRHLDDDTDNNSVENLAWGTQSENIGDALRNGLHPKASQVDCARGHVLAGVNLIPRAKAQRQCRTCHRAVVYARRHPETEFGLQSLSDSHLEWISDPSNPRHLPNYIIERSALGKVD